MNASARGQIIWRQLWNETAALTGRAEARWLCEEASGCFGEEFVEVLDAPASERAVAHLDAMLARLRAGEPLQYVLGRWSFRRLDLLVDQRVLIPRPETELVAEHAIALVRQVAAERARPRAVADLGTGSGALGLSLAAELPRGLVEVWLTDNSADALDVARANAAGLGMAGECVRFGHGSWYAALPAALRGELALVVSNPPYIARDDAQVAANVRDWEPHAALFAGDDGLADVRVVVAGATEWLAPGGWLVIEIGAGQRAAATELMTAAGLTQVDVFRDLAGLDRIAVGRRVP
ncbi:MAG: peptide chain release factor N(5)-glutamine methyltransferase [Actinomycetia bacterium]|nr:peptide chain release factor N(5)-glutamine methyltransferase [Actinomycetes bacterium]